MSEIGAPAAAPSAPTAPSAPAGGGGSPGTPIHIAGHGQNADPRGAPPRGHKWAPPVAAKPKAPSLQATPPQETTAPQRPQGQRTPQQVATGERQQAKPTENKTPIAPREPRLIKHVMPDGTEAEIDISEQFEAALSGYKRKVKVNGEEREYSLSEAFERLPLAEGAHGRFREASEIQKQAQARETQLREALKPLTNPKQALSVLTKIHGPEVAQQMMEEFLAAQYQREAMPPAERRALEEREAAQRGIESEREKLARERAEFDAQRKESHDAQFKAEQAQWTERYKRDFGILLGNEKLPNTPRMLARLANIVEEARTLKIPYTNEQCAKALAKEYREELEHFAQNADPETVRAMLGQNADKLRQADVERVMAQPGRGRTVVAKKSAIPQSIKTPDQLRKHLREQDLAAERRGR